jgi:hypothetical protein
MNRDQAQAAGRDDAPDAAGARRDPQTLIQESIKYRRRAQEAERRAETLEAEVQNLRQGRDDRNASLETDLAQARADADSLRGRLESVERDRQLERELARAGCADAETALALAQQRLAGGPPPEDLAAFARGLLEEKPHLRGTGAAPAAAKPDASRPPRGLPPRTAAARADGASAPHRAAERLAERARQSGNSGDLMAYMRARRTA